MFNHLTIETVIFEEKRSAKKKVRLSNKTLMALRLRATGQCHWAHLWSTLRASLGSIITHNREKGRLILYCGLHFRRRT
eukprot:2025438-Amphidinium_carterae.1